ncbi:hypothetical protein L3X38_042842 [Prunus dulcis]|uniref:Uncharacterized protein n=1 Tax=Prunus dulcis TaxID=3755 RepID=A0AAD4UXF5_PRUDU|nr:hypothetical protein L3X38_042842 [Prunus dulcis]
MWLGNEPSNWGTNSQPARTVETLKARTSVTSPTCADYPIKGLQQHPVKDAPSSDNSKYLKFPYLNSKSGEEFNLESGCYITPVAPIKISARRKEKKADAQHISIELVEEEEEPKAIKRASMFNRLAKPTQRTSDFSRIKELTSRPSVFKRIYGYKSQRGIRSAPRRLALERLGVPSKPSEEKNQQELKSRIHVD